MKARVYVRVARGKKAVVKVAAHHRPDYRPLIETVRGSDFQAALSFHKGERTEVGA